MESAGVIEIFCSSVEKFNLGYTKCLGNGDTGSFLRQYSQNSSDNLIPIKLEFVRHYQKRSGTQLRQKGRDLKSVEIADGKGISGQGKLTDKEINPLKNYVGMAIRQDCNNVFEITNAAIAMLYHYTALKLKVLRHLYCAKGKDSCFK